MRRPLPPKFSYQNHYRHEEHANATNHSSTVGNTLTNQSGQTILSKHLAEQQFSTQTPPSFHPADVMNCSSSATISKQISVPSSPLVVLPLTTSNSTSTVFTNPSVSSSQMNRLYQIRSRPQQQTGVINRSQKQNELAEYAKQYEDLYTRRMGASCGNSSTSASGSVPSAVSSASIMHRSPIYNYVTNDLAEEKRGGSTETG